MGSGSSERSEPGEAGVRKLVLRSLQWSGSPRSESRAGGQVERQEEGVRVLGDRSFVCGNRIIADPEQVRKKSWLWEEDVEFRSEHVGF